MSRESAFRGTFSPNKRPYVVVTPDVYVAFQGETSIIGCGECLRQVSVNDYVTGISTEASVDSGTPGSATINLSIPDNDVNDFYVDGQLLIIPMMEVEIYSKGYFLVGGFPQYYRIFWGLVSSVSKSWSGGTTTISISCKDILRWWEITMTTTNPGFIDKFGSSAGNFQFWGNQYAGMNPYTVIISLAQEAMGDFSVTTGSFKSFLPEHGPEGQVIASYAKDIMAYWQLKFSNMWNSLVLYGTSGQAYSFGSESATASKNQLAALIFKDDLERSFVNQTTTMFRPQPNEIAAVKKELDKAADFQLNENEQQSKLSLATTCALQNGFEFYCDTTGDIIFKPPFYNLNVLPNKPISWVQDFEIIEDSITDTEAEVVTHITGSGNAFGGVMDWGLTDSITSPNSGVYDFHLLRRYGWRKHDYQCEWSGNPRKLFFHMMDYLDRLNSKRQNGTVTIPLRPEIRMGFPMWFPKYDSFFYIQGISHQYSVGGQATTTLNLTAKRSKFIAPSNIGSIKQSGVKESNPPKGSGEAGTKRKVPTYTVEFPDRPGSTTGQTQSVQEGSPVFLRDPKTGKMLGYPNVVMVYRAKYDDDKSLKSLAERMGNPPPKQSQTQSDETEQSINFKQKEVAQAIFLQLQSEQKKDIIDRLRAHRYEAGMTNAGAYDYAFDVSRQIKDFQLIPIDSVTWQPANSGGSFVSEANKKTLEVQKKSDIKKTQDDVDAATKSFKEASNELIKSTKTFNALIKARNKKDSLVTVGSDTEVSNAASDIEVKKNSLGEAKKILDEAKENNLLVKKNLGDTQRFASLNMMIRPVSDEFGFEVIGHYKYGRGSFIDRGQLKINTGDPQNLANEINLQFAPSGGFLTDPSVIGSATGHVVSYASSFEKMQPDDYVTGASFKGYATGGPTDVVQTSQNTYTNLMNSNTGKSVFIEADSLRKSKTLGELSPTIDLPGLDSAHKPCSCGLSRGDWLSVLPVEFITKIVNSKDMIGSIRETFNSEVNPESQEKITGINSEIDAVISAKQASADAEIGELSLKESFGETQITNLSADLTPSSMSISEAKAEIELNMKKFTDSQNESRRQRISSLPNTISSLTTHGINPKESVFTGSVSSNSFFDALNDFLSSEFTRKYSFNVQREKNYTVGNRSIERSTQNDPVIRQSVFSNNLGSPLFGNPEDNILAADDPAFGDPIGPLFAAAARGDKDAIEAIKQKANFNFGSTQKALGNLKDAWKSGKEKIEVVINDLHFGDPNDSFKGRITGQINTTPVPQTQPHGQPLPLPTIISQKDVSRLKSVTVGSAILNAPVIISNDQDFPLDGRMVGPVPPPDFVPTPSGVPNITILKKS